MIELSDLILVFILFCIVALIWHNASFKELALRAAQNHCEQMQVQLLDESMVIKRIWPQRSHSGLLVLRREYQFEFTATGDQRHSGEVTLVGSKLKSVQLSPHPFIH